MSHSAQFDPLSQNTTSHLDTSTQSPSESLQQVADVPVFKVYNPSNFVNAAPAPSLPDEYFTPTASDLKAAQATLSARTQALVNAPLQLRATREATEKAKRARWPQTTIRIRFTDRTQLEKVFPSTDKIRSVYAFVRSCLREDVRPIKFILYQSPPKRDLKVSDPNVRDLSLADLQLAPSSILLLRFEDETLNHTNISAPLAPSVLALATDLPMPPSLDQDIPPGGSNHPQSSANSNSMSKPGEKKIPKWLKLGLKK
ncbi:hypothetical protein BDQ12DRAFT_483391 [Crucibulum laeve]|uniref:UBX domain-containing protein n=1 Tax=Crucibulum laeve TaxID=68775 RepID=A0A5C3M8C2_9AGAR|nr:hypothetical protein BDQ12DRAFT_483391 [Crucibulum laeve]